jgi:hypothetical protein
VVVEKQPIILVKMLLDECVVTFGVLVSVTITVVVARSVLVCCCQIKSLFGGVSP